MQYLPLMHQFSGKACLLVGGGKVALRRAKRITDASGTVDVVAPNCLPDLASLVTCSGGAYHDREYQTGDVSEKYSLVVAATDDREVNQKITDDARALKIPVNVVDDADQCDVIFPTIVDRDPVLVAISSGSNSPQFSKLLRDRINTFLPEGYGQLAELFGRYRNEVKARISSPGARASFWNKVVHGYIAESGLSGNMEKAEQQFRNALENPALLETGEVYLIGAGPGDPDLLTLRAFRLLQRAQVILYDRLVSPRILERLDDGKELIFVGKARSRHPVPQTEINQLLVDHAKQGKKVARLKGGDPFIFGRGGEEIENLAAENIPFQVIPGISAANGCSAYAGIPLTHRDHAQSVRFVTGHLKDGTLNLDWASLVAPDQTLVFYMGLEGLALICEKLIENGMEPTTPAALVEKGTTPDQRVYVRTLETLGSLSEETEVRAPTLTIVGSVVTLHAALEWFNPED